MSSSTERQFLERASAPDGQFISKSHHIALVVNDQLDGCTVPIFDDSRAVSGHVSIDGLPSVHGVELELKGVTNLHEFGGLKSTRTILEETLPLWTRESKDLPAQIPFEFSLSRQGTARLPPTYDARVGAGDMHDENGFTARVMYTLTIKVQEHHSGLVAVTHTSDALDHKLTTPFVLVSRLKSPHTSLPRAAELATSETTKIAQTEHVMRATGDGTVKVTVELPDPNIFSIRSPIPVCLRVVGANVQLSTFKAAVKRHGVMTMETWMDTIENIGETEFRKVAGTGTESDPLVLVADVVVNDSVSVGGFVSDGLAIHDFLTIVIDPPKEDPGALLRDSKITLPINLTTD